MFKNTMEEIKKMRYCRTAKMRQRWKFGLIAGGLILGGVIAILVSSFPTVEYYQMGFPRSQTTGTVQTEKVYSAGKYLMSPDTTFKTFLKTVHFEEFKLASVSTADKLEIGLTTYFQYFLRPHQLSYLHETFDTYYRPILKSNALDALKNTAVFYTVREYIRERELVEKAFQTAVRERLSGKCCEKDCGQERKRECMAQCKPYSECGTGDWGLFADMVFFQLTRVQIPDELSERFENALLLYEKNEEAKLRQESAVVRKETVQQVAAIDNEADVISQGASANATLIRNLAKADAKLLVENARITGMKHMYAELNITTDAQKSAFDYLRTLKEKELVRLAIDFQSYIAGDLGTPSGTCYVSKSHAEARSKKNICPSLPEEKSNCSEREHCSVVELFSQMGGPTPNKLASHIMNRIMDCTAAQSFNIRGTGNKVSFRNYDLYTMVFEGVKLAFPNARRGVDAKIHSAILENLRASGSKLNRRKERATSVNELQRMAAARSEARDEEVLHQTGELEDDAEDEDDYEEEQD